MPGGPTDPIRGPTAQYDKVAPKFSGWDNQTFQEAGFRAVPNCTVRRGFFIAPGVVLMLSFVNIGAYVDSGTMASYVGNNWLLCTNRKNCHISGGVGIGGVLEPLQADPVIIGDNCFAGARSEVAEGVILEDGAVLSMGVFLGASTKIVDRQTGKLIPAAFHQMPSWFLNSPGKITDRWLCRPFLYCAVVIVKRVDDRTQTDVNK